MKIYFLSEGSCALKINGEYVGVTDGGERYLPLSTKDSPLVEWLPLAYGLPTTFLLTEDVVYSPPQGVAVFLFPEGLALRFTPSRPPSAPVNVLYSGEGVLLYRQGGVWLATGKKVLSMPEFSSEITGHVPAEGALLLTDGKRLVGLYEEKPFFQGEIEGLRLEGEVSFVSPLNDLRARKGHFCYRFDGGVELVSFSTIGGKELPPAFELACLMDDVRLRVPLSGAGERLEGERAFLQEYFGDMRVVVPLADRFCAGVYRLRQGVYELRTFTAEEGLLNIRRVW